MTIIPLLFLLFMAAYILGVRDGFKGRPPPAEKGTYDSGEHEDRVEEYEDWT